MVGLGYVCAIVLAGIFVRAAVAKAVHPAETVAGFAALGVPGAAAVAKGVPVVELGLAVALLSVPRLGGVAALVTLGAFSAFLARALRAGTTAGCNCFGQARVQPLSGTDLVRNGLLGLLGGAALLAPRPVVPGVVAVVSIFVAVVAGAALLRLSRLRQARIGPPQ